MTQASPVKPNIASKASDVRERRPLKVVIPGGTGQVGTMLTRALRRDGHQVVLLSRAGSRIEAQMAVKNASIIDWDGRTLGLWKDSLEGADVVINLAGQSVNCRYNRQNRERIFRSRVDSTRLIGDAIRAARRPPRVWLQASTATIYAHRFDAPNDEFSGIIGGSEPNAPPAWRFSIEVAKAWERTLDEAETPHTRKLKLRSAMIMSPDRGGIFDTLLRLVRFGLGGRAGDGRQYISWVHHQDFVRALYWLIEHEEIDGVVNIASPNPLPNADFMRALREAWGIRFGLPAAKWMLPIGTWLMRTESELILKSRRVVPGVLTRNGFVFRHPTWPEAAQSLCREWRSTRRLSATPALGEN